MYYLVITTSRSFFSTSFKFKLSVIGEGRTAFLSHIAKYLDILKNNNTSSCDVSNLSMHITYNLEFLLVEIYLTGMLGECVKTYVYGKDVHCSISANSKELEANNVIWVGTEINACAEAGIHRTAYH